MVLTELTGLLAIAVGGYALAKPMLIRTFPTPAEWETDPESARQEQRAYAAMTAFFLILGGIGLVVLGLLGRGP
jgi:hypothetical protein